jgi:hypothetical protein
MTPMQLVRCQAVLGTSVKLVVFWAVGPGSLVETDQRYLLPSSSG